MPTKVWPLHPLCKLSEITGDKFSVRGKHSNILVALATQHVKKKPLVSPPLAVSTESCTQTWHCREMDASEALSKTLVVDYPQNRSTLCKPHRS